MSPSPGQPKPCRTSSDASGWGSSDGATGSECCSSTATGGGRGPRGTALVEECFEVFRAPGLQEALEKARAAAPDVVVLAPPEPEWVLGLRGLPGQPALLAMGEVSPRVPATAWSAVIPNGLSEPDAVLHAIKGLDIVQRRRRTGRDRRQGLDRRR